ncbi:hypothetical protein SAMN04515667_1568 [Formosa sp. Hel1_31_208]|uniref:hypothetical protein n=1 Tax=Formosa sp. Hel1_31_208 TaxID=1798225 RepID=UPI00087CC780|nr:hypothetical protein [Formosa sp. Hel1_31_208]SDS16978.1 hypothetical protein SAMN04515667_1568 [Formosa sp. Hel1_31_208]
MKTIRIILIFVFLYSCSSTQLVESWKNPEIDTYEPYKVLIVGLTSDIEARTQFEKQLKKEFELRGTQASMSLNILTDKQKTERLTEADLDALETQLILDEYDTILLTKIIGVDDKIAYRQDYGGYDETRRRFTEEYLMYQDVFYNPEYYSEYTIYHAETSMYCICPTKDRELIWKGYIDITDPTNVEQTIKDYVRLTIVVLEEEQLVKRIDLDTQENLQDTVSN